MTVTLFLRAWGSERDSLCRVPPSLLARTQVTASAASVLGRPENVSILNNHKRNRTKILFLFEFSTVPPLTNRNLFPD